MQPTNSFHDPARQGLHHYPLENLDLLVTVTLNPARPELGAIDEEQSEKLCGQLNQEEARLQLLIKTQVFSLSKKNEIILFTRRYYSSLIILLDQSLENQKRTSKNRFVRTISKAVLSCLERLLSFIETRFSQYLDKNMRAPATYFSVSQKELRRRVEVLKIKTAKNVEYKGVSEIIISSLDNFTTSSNPGYEVTFLTILYYKVMVKELERFNCSVKNTEGFSRLDELLISLNFNSKAYINYLTGFVMDKINACETVAEKMDMLLFYNKAFNQLRQKRDLIYNPNYDGLKTVIGNWFVQEIRYLEKKMQWSSNLQEIAPATKLKPSPVKVVQKILIKLSSDQAGLIFRAADDLRIVVAKSLSEVFKTIVPHLSTPYQEELSYKGMRTQSYVAEERDKEIAIETLERIIKKIREYGGEK